MAHYAFMNLISPGIYKVTEVIPGRNEDEIVDGISNWEEHYGDFRGQKCVRTSYNAATNGFRKNFAGIGYTYDEALDAFIPPKPFESWILDENTCRWNAPVAMPNDGSLYTWDEQSLSWVEVPTN